MTGPVEPRRHPVARLLLGRAAFLISNPFMADGKHHFVREYGRLVRRLKADYPTDEAMSLAVGGHYDEIGERLAKIMLEAGITDHSRLLDLGCGSGRLPSALSRKIDINYTGVDIIPELLSYARKRSPPSYRFILNRDFNLPVETSSFDFFSAFSVFTHLRHEESYSYICEAHRVLKPGGILILSVLEFGDPAHWHVFEETLDATRRSRPAIANVFIERSTIAVWADKIGFSIPTFYGSESVGHAAALGQSLALLKRV